MKHAIAVIAGILFAACLVLSDAVGHLYMERTSLAQRLTASEAHARTTASKLYDLQERQSDELEAARGEASVELWNAQQALEACRKAR